MGFNFSGYQKQLQGEGITILDKEKLTILVKSKPLVLKKKFLLYGWVRDEIVTQPYETVMLNGI